MGVRFIVPNPAPPFLFFNFTNTKLSNNPVYMCCSSMSSRGDLPPSRSISLSSRTWYKPPLFCVWGGAAGGGLWNTLGTLSSRRIPSLKLARPRLSKFGCVLLKKDNIPFLLSAQNPFPLDLIIAASLPLPYHLYPTIHYPLLMDSLGLPFGR